MKEITSKSTPINIAAQRICEKIKIQQDNYHAEINRQRDQLPVLVDRSKFCLGELITHQCIEFISRELDVAKLLAKNSARRASKSSKDLSEPNEIGCTIGCELPMRYYGLSCKCWLYRSVVDEISIPLSLIHPRWLFYGSDFVPQGAWMIVFDPDLTFEHLMQNCYSRLDCSNQNQLGKL